LIDAGRVEQKLTNGCKVALILLAGVLKSFDPPHPLFKEGTESFKVLLKREIKGNRPSINLQTKALKHALELISLELISR
jgi:hypothetical protein